jgi:hypothetical protein
MKKYLIFFFSLNFFIVSLSGQGSDGLAVEVGIMHTSGALNYLGYNLSLGTRIEGSGYDVYSFIDVNLGGGHRSSYRDPYDRNINNTYVFGLLRVGVMKDLRNPDIVPRVGLSLSCIAKKIISSKKDLPVRYIYINHTEIAFMGNLHASLGRWELIGSLGTKVGKDKSLQIETRGDYGVYTPVANASLVPLIKISGRWLFYKKNALSYCIF